MENVTLAPKEQTRPRDGANRVTHRIFNTGGNPYHPELRGSVRLDGCSVIRISEFTKHQG